MTPEARAARERKQKIFVVVGGLFLLAMLAFQLPKLLGGSSPAEAAASSDTTVPGSTLPITAARSVAAAANARTSLTGGAGVSLASTAKLTSFSLFAPKDPFVQQVATPTGVGAMGTAKGAGGAGGAKGETSSKKFSTGTTAAATIVVVNGARQVVETGAKFPASDPLFVLVAENPKAKSVVIGIVGGAYGGGAKTATLKVGKPLTLVNTTTGARYKISLVSVGSGDQGAKPEESQQKQ